MCGILGSLNFPLNIEQTRSLLLHRGPDAQTEWKYNNIILHHFRLSILDHEGGKQPMHYLDRYTIIFNGEMYNHLDVRKKFNLDCKTNSDTETVLHAFHRLGMKCLNEFDGMFALCIHDRQENKIFLARDRAGKKPLYYYKKANEFVFASELRALNILVNDSINDSSINQYLHLGYMFESSTPFLHITEVPSGTFLEIDCGTLDMTPKKYWDIGDFYQKSFSGSYEEAVDKVDSYLIDGVKGRLLSSDLEVGAFLSGGIDSGLVTAIASSYTDVPLKTFTVRFKGEYDESPLAQLVSDKYKTDHRVIDISFDNLKDDIENILINYGEPFMDSSAIPSYYVAREAKKHVTVVLNGDGADELFGGYRRYVPYSVFPFLSSSQFQKNIFGGINKLLPVSHNKKSKYNYIKRLITLASKSELDQYLSATSDVFTNYENEFLTKPFDSTDIGKRFSEIVDSSDTDLQAMMQADFKFLLFGDLLVKMDIATMAHSLEGRSAFLSKELLEFVPQLPDKFRLKGNYTKRILRDLAKKYLPPELVNQPKRGFEIPLKSWVNNELKEVIWDNLNSKNSYIRDFVNEKCLNMLSSNTNNIPEEKRAKMIWSLFSLEIWNKNINN